MKSRLNELKAILPPPSKPYPVFDDWSGIEFALQTSLPDDYKAFIAAYGSGNIHDAGCDFERNIGTSCDPSVLNPFDHTRGNNFYGAIGTTIWSIGEGHKNYREYYPYPPWPHAGGLLCWATTGNGDYFFWLTEGKPNDWKVVVRFGRWAVEDFYKSDADGAIDFLVQMLTNRIESRPKLMGGSFVDPAFNPKQHPSDRE